MYYAGFQLEPTTSRIVANVAADRGRVYVNFYGLGESPADSHSFPASEAEQGAARKLNARIEAYLRSNLPSTYTISAGTERPSPRDTL